MKKFSMTFCGASILILTIALPTPSFAGSVIFRNKENDNCSVVAPPPGETKQFDLTKDSCRGIAIRKMEIVDLPSATQILLTDSPSCSKSLTDPGENWYWFEFKTTRKRTSLGITEIEYLDTFNPPSMIGTGVQMTGKASIRPPYDMRDTLSCIKLTMSKEPETSPPTSSSPSK